MRPKAANLCTKLNFCFFLPIDPVLQLSADQPEDQSRPTLAHPITVEQAHQCMAQIHPDMVAELLCMAVKHPCMTPEVELPIMEARPHRMGKMVHELLDVVAHGILQSPTHPRPIATMMITPLMTQRRVPTTILELQDTTKRAQVLPIHPLHQDPCTIHRRVTLLISLLHLLLVAINVSLI